MANGLVTWATDSTLLHTTPSVCLVSKLSVVVKATGTEGEMGVPTD